jgi:hypothetical protein
MCDRPDDYRDWLADSIEDADRLDDYNYEVAVPTGVPGLYVSQDDDRDPLRQTLWATISPGRHEALVEPEAPAELPAVLDDLGLDVRPIPREVSA